MNMNEAEGYAIVYDGNIVFSDDGKTFKVFNSVHHKDAKDELFKCNKKFDEKIKAELVQIKIIKNGGSNITCPFCLEDNFDEVGLKVHLEHFCNQYDNISIKDRMA